MLANAAQVDFSFLRANLPKCAETVPVEDQGRPFTFLPYQLVDVGGARPERRRWASALDDAFCLVFVVSLVEYQQVLFEQPKEVTHSFLAIDSPSDCLTNT